jgi:hypothetical protein
MPISSGFHALLLRLLLRLSPLSLLLLLLQLQLQQNLRCPWSKDT